MTGPTPRADGAPGFAVIGTGRSGTGWMSQLLTQAGIDCGHELWWNPTGQRRTGLDGDSSWLALPDIEAGVWSGPVVHVVRHPVEVVRSLVSTRLFRPPDRANPFGRFARAHEPAIEGLVHLEAAVEWWVSWNTRCAAVADLTLDLPAVPESLERIGEVIGHPIELDELPDRHNAKPRLRDVDEARVWRLLDGRAEAFGYRPEG